MADRIAPQILAPFRIPLFRRVWPAGVFSNFGSLIQAVAAAWLMSSLTSDAATIGLVQTASSAPMMCLALLSGSIADIYDRRTVALVALAIGMLGASALLLVTIQGWVTPPLLIALCLVTGCGTTLFGPAWQASVREQVPRDYLPAAVALNSVSFNLGRSLGPAVGGTIVALAGAGAAFAANALSFVPLFVVLLLWRKPPADRTIQREPLIRVIALGVGYIANAPAIWKVLGRVFLQAFGNSAVLAVLVLYVRAELGGDAGVYGGLLAGFGLGAVAGASLLPGLQHRFSREVIVRASGLTMGCVLLVLSLTRSIPLTATVLIPAGACWTIASTLFNVSIQTSAPRWIAGRALAAFQTAVAGGVAIGSWFWGATAGALGMTGCLGAAAAYCALAQVAGRWLRMPDAAASEHREGKLIPDPAMAGPVQGDAGPIQIEVEYRVPLARTDEFCVLMNEIKAVRRRSGAGEWSLGLDLADRETWLERFTFPTWNDYLRFRNRPSVTDRRLMLRVREIHEGSEAPVTRRFVERPDFPDGSVAQPVISPEI